MLKIFRDLEELGLKLDLAGPDVDADVRRVIGRYGEKEVNDAIKRQTQLKRGRPTDPDWVLLLPTIELDAREWLDGGNPQTTRSNYSIAKTFADNENGRSHPATMRRIQDKLKKNRIPNYLLLAVDISHEGYSFTKHLKALDAVAEVISVGPNYGEIARAAVRDFKARSGKRPPAKMSIAEIQRAVLGMQNARDKARSTDVQKGLGALLNYRR